MIPTNVISIVKKIYIKKNDVKLCHKGYNVFFLIFPTYIFATVIIISLIYGLDLLFNIFFVYIYKILKEEKQI